MNSADQSFNLYITLINLSHSTANPHVKYSTTSQKQAGLPRSIVTYLNSSILSIFIFCGYVASIVEVLLFIRCV